MARDVPPLVDLSLFLLEVRIETLWGRPVVKTQGIVRYTLEVVHLSYEGVALSQS